jgi:hypothetical protein
MGDFFHRFDWNQDTRNQWQKDADDQNGVDDLLHQLDIEQQTLDIVGSAGRIHNEIHNINMDNLMDAVRLELESEDTIVNDFVHMLHTFNGYLIRVKGNMDTFAGVMDDFVANPQEQQVDMSNEMHDFLDQFNAFNYDLNEIYRWAMALEPNQNPNPDQVSQFGLYMHHLYLKVSNIGQFVEHLTEAPPENEPDSPLALGFQQFSLVFAIPAISFVTEIIPQHALHFLLDSILQKHEDIMELGIVFDSPRLFNVR